MVKKYSEENDEIQNFIEEKYYIKNRLQGEGKFNETCLATLIDDSTKLFACKIINKKNISFRHLREEEII